MDYLKLLCRVSAGRFLEMMQVIDKGLESARRDSGAAKLTNMITKLTSIKAFLICVHNPHGLNEQQRRNEAVNLWMDVIINYPEEFSRGIYVNIL